MRAKDAADVDPKDRPYWYKPRARKYRDGAGEKKLANTFDVLEPGKRKRRLLKQIERVSARQRRREQEQAQQGDQGESEGEDPAP